MPKVPNPWSPKNKNGFGEVNSLQQALPLYLIKSNKRALPNDIETSLPKGENLKP